MINVQNNSTRKNFKVNGRKFFSQKSSTGEYFNVYLIFSYGPCRGQCTWVARCERDDESTVRAAIEQGKRNGEF